MNWKIYILFSALFLTLHACVIEEAKPSVHQRIVFYSDSYCPADSLIIQEFEQKKHVSVQVVYKNKDEIAQLIQKDKFNTGIDVLLLSSDSLRENLYNQSLFSPLKGRSFFINMNRQFNNNHSYWVPICHNPLILAVKKDSSSNCQAVNWGKLSKDSVRPKIAIQSNVNAYVLKLNKTKKFAALTGTSNVPVSPKYTIYTLSQIAELANKGLQFERSHCFYYLVENQRFITNFTSVSLYRYGRNKIAAEQFIEFYSRFQYQIASNRNQLSTFRPIQPNFLIRSLEID